MRKTRTAGGVVLGPDGRVIVVSQHAAVWSLPKGHVEPGESDRAAAEREIFEEAGIRQLTYVRDLGTYQRFKLARGGEDDLQEQKTIVMFLYRTEETALCPQDAENPEAIWVEKEVVTTLLTHRKDKAFFEGVRKYL